MRLSASLLSRALDREVKAVSSGKSRPSGTFLLPPIRDGNTNPRAQPSVPYGAGWPKRSDPTDPCART
ncbi:hypothetical protein EXIGLDRAFT_284057 [Exidia glandulosa HHB12029]|uniref:Uncharacterized protein n=1 Tax=Exidia glandulosa HHB12029 TaxID=1314781 RepID=A0A165DHK8_EXIGL|nr:hypothetical protein EXIGLDRAFT_284057 [Exidia glandulosa HHB12029]